MMQAVVYRENGLFTLEQRPVPGNAGGGGRNRPRDALLHLLERPAYQARQRAARKARRDRGP